MKDQRNAELAKIHVIARRNLGMDEDSYRDMLEMITGRRSAGDLDRHQRAAVLDHLAKLSRPKLGAQPTNTEAKPELTKIHALLAEAKRPWSYADSLAKRMYRVDRVAWCNADQLRGIIAALANDAKRHGRRER